MIPKGWDGAFALWARALILGTGVWTLGIALFGSALAEQGGARGAVIAAGLAGLAFNLAAPGPLARRLGERLWGALGLGIALLLVLLGIYWALVYSSMQGSDFGVYYNCGVSPAPDLDARIAQCQGHYMPPNLVYWGRSVLYSIPLGTLFGPSPEAFDLANALYQGAALVLLFHLMRRAFGAPAALVSVLAWGLLPERVYAITLVTSDNLVALAIVAVLALSARARIGPGETLALALLLLAINLLRNAGPVLALALLGGAIALADERRRRRVVAVAAALALYAALGALIGATLPMDDDSRDLLKLVSALDLGSVQDWTTGGRWVYDLLPAVPAQEQRSLELRALVLELTHHIGLYPGYMAAKAGILTGGNGYATFASLDLSANADTVLTVPRSDVPLPDAYSLPYRSFATCLIGMALAGVLRGPRTQLLMTATAVVGLFFLPFYLFAEVQPRYLFMPGIALAILSGAAWANDPEAQGKGPEHLRRRWEPALGVVVIGLAAAVLALGLILARSQVPNPLAGTVATVTADCPSRGATLEPGLHRLRLVFPPGVSCGALTVPVDADAHSVSFLIARPDPALGQGPRPETGIRWRILAPEATEHRGDLGTTSARWYRLGGPKESKPGSLTIVFSRSATDTAQAIELTDLSIDDGD